MSDGSRASPDAQLNRAPGGAGELSGAPKDAIATAAHVVTITATPSTHESSDEPTAADSKPSPSASAAAPPSTADDAVSAEPERGANGATVADAPTAAAPCQQPTANADSDASPEHHRHHHIERDTATDPVAADDTAGTAVRQRRLLRARHHLHMWQSKLSDEHVIRVPVIHGIPVTAVTTAATSTNPTTSAATSIVDQLQQYRD